LINVEESIERKKFTNTLEETALESDLRKSSQQVEEEPSSDTWRSLVDKIYSRFNGEGDSVLFDMGHRYGTDIAIEAKRQDMDSSKAFLTLVEKGLRSGLGNIEVDGDSIFGENLIVRVTDCPFCSGVSAVRPLCHFFRGVISGMSEVLYGRSFNIIERNCTATGNRCCEYVLEEQSYSDYRLV
jgi:predicted hydrocarbon binding protein